MDAQEQKIGSDMRQESDFELLPDFRQHSSEIARLRDISYRLPRLGSLAESLIAMPARPGA